MPDVFTKAKRSQVMSRIRGRGNKETEIALARLLRKNKISGWRRHRLIKLKVPGSKFQIQSRKKAGGASVDFVFQRRRVAVFVDGCFWHGCPKHCRMPKGNRSFWKRKLSGNRLRDELVTRTLRRDGWRVLRIWEHELAGKNLPRLRLRILRALQRVDGVME